MTNVLSDFVHVILNQHHIYTQNSFSGFTQKIRFEGIYFRWALTQNKLKVLCCRVDSGTQK